MTSHINIPAGKYSTHHRVYHGVQHLALILLVLTLFSTVTAFFFWRWLPYLGSRLIGPPEDNMQDFWNIWYVTVASKPNQFFFTDLIRFPEGTPLYYHSFAYPKLFAISLLAKFIGANASALILLQNLGLLISFPLAGTGAFYLVRYFTADRAGALWSTDFLCPYGALQTRSTRRQRICCWRF